MNITSKMSNKLQKKQQRKQKKYKDMLFSEVGINVTSTATKYIAICNAGLVNGLSEEVIYDNFITIGEIENIIMVPGKSICFLSFYNTESAQKAFEKFNGQLQIAQDHKPVHLQYTDNIPNFIKRCKKYPEGFIVIEDFVNEEEEQSLLAICDFQTNSECIALKNRLTKSYGYQFNYDVNNVSKDTPMEKKIPKECDFLWSRLSEKSSKFSHFVPDQLTINYYKPGDGIAPHIDTHSAFEDPILSLSLGSSANMEFKLNDERIDVHLPQRSLAILSGESRYAWSHAIVGRKYDIIPKNNTFTIKKRLVRTSFTFRKVLCGECGCKFPQYCDSYQKNIATCSLDDSYAVNIENDYVHKVYENISTHFDSTRHKPWPGVIRFLNSFELGSIVVDVGCGNGKNMAVCDKVITIGCDYSKNLLDVCRNRNCEVFASNCLHLPLLDKSVDGVISIAVIHHLANHERRLSAVKEMVRILRIGAKGLIYVWAKDQYKKDEQHSKYIKKNRQESTSVLNMCKNITVSGDVTLPVHINRTTFQHQDMLVPWIKKDKNDVKDKSEETFFRFYHTFEEKELLIMCSGIDSVKIVDYYYDEGNWCCIFEKFK